MDDISQRIGQILNDPESMSEIMNIAKSLGLTDEKTSEEKRKESEKPVATNEIVNAVMQLSPLISQVKKDDESTNLLRALKPLLSEKRQEKVDGAIKIIQLLKLLPVLKENSALKNILSSVF